MTTFTDKDEVRRRAATKSRNPTIQAQIISVDVRDPGDDNSNITCDVVTRETDQMLENRPIEISSHEGHVVVPQEGDWVKVELFGKRGTGAVITGFVHTEEQLPAYAEKGHWRHEFRRDGSDPLYVEAEPADHSSGDPDVVRMGIKPDGVSDPSTEVAIDDSGETTEISISTDGNVTVDADGDASVTADGTVSIDGNTVDLGGGGKGIITDITTSTDADGHVTDISLTRSNTVSSG